MDKKPFRLELVYSKDNNWNDKCEYLFSELEILLITAANDETIEYSDPLINSILRLQESKFWYDQLPSTTEE